MYIANLSLRKLETQLWGNQGKKLKIRDNKFVVIVREVLSKNSVLILYAKLKKTYLLYMIFKIN